ncbi:helix-turn-helix transcriptional regulator [Methylocystis sp. FS]|uniref:winged helix-turn-helix transcriptional regulator n=1 Tax=Methylocystis silviterrae TaxID=2743612 RepID=UPI0015833DB2|nr:helix-turn-helix domain-containing protein [Methylocystis silviterrae]NUJ81342.1 helix-turn-helix transcriptional regulator [Methylocystis silviterrae]
MRKQRHQTYTCCPLEAALDVMGSKWKATILFRLLDGTRRFNELRRLMPNVTQRMLTIQLRELEADGMIRRKVFPEVPPKVEYSLSELGRTLEPLLRELYQWGQTHIQRRLPGAATEPPSGSNERDARAPSN